MAAVMRRSKTRPKRRARNRAEALNIGNWFAKLTKSKQDKYVKDHPNSIYAKQKRKATDKKTRTKESDDRIHKLESMVAQLEKKIAHNKKIIASQTGETGKARASKAGEKHSWEYARENMELKHKIKVYQDRIQRLR